MNRSTAATAIFLAGLMLGLAGDRAATAQVTTVWGGPVNYGTAPYFPNTSYYGSTAAYGNTAAYVPQTYYSNPTATYGAGYVAPNAAYTPLSSYRAPLGSAYNQHWNTGRWQTLQPTYYQASGVVSTSTPETTAGYTPSTVFPSSYSGVTAYRAVVPGVQTPNTVYSPVAAPIATPSMYVGRAVTTPPMIDTYAPRNFYRTAYYPTSVTYYRPVVAQDPTTGQAVTVLQPCTGYEYQARRQFSLFQSAAAPTCSTCAPGYYGNGAVVPGPAVPATVGPAPMVRPGPYSGGAPYIAPPGSRLPADERPSLDVPGYRPGSVRSDVIDTEPPPQYGDGESRRIEYRGRASQYDVDSGEPDRDGWRNVGPRRTAPSQTAPSRTVPSNISPSQIAPRQTVRDSADEQWRNSDEPTQYRARPTTPDSGYKIESDSAPQLRQRVPASTEPDADGWRNVEPGQTSKVSPRKKVAEPAREENARSEVRRPAVRPSKPEVADNDVPAMRGSRGQVRREPAASPKEEPAKYSAEESVADASSTRDLPSTWEPSEPKVNRPKVQPLRDENIEKPRLPRISTPPLLNRDDRSASLPERDEAKSQTAASSNGPVWAFVKVDWNRSKVKREQAAADRKEKESLPTTEPSDDENELEPIGPVEREELAPVPSKTNRTKKRGFDEQWQSLRGR